jgi:hypothetical protein
MFVVRPNKHDRSHRVSDLAEILTQEARFSTEGDVVWDIEYLKEVCVSSPRWFVIKSRSEIDGIFTFYFLACKSGLPSRKTRPLY